MVCFCDFPLGKQNIIILLKIVILFKSKLAERDDPYSSDVIDSSFVEGYWLENLNYNY